MWISPGSVRQRNAAATREAILTAARRRFAAESYENVGLREVAGDVGVDASLVGRYFGSKEELFAEVVSAACNQADFMSGDPKDFPARMADALINDPPHSHKIETLLIMMRSASSTVAAEVVQRTVTEKMQKPFATWLGGADAMARARIASALMLGMAVSRSILRDQAMSKEERRRFAKRLKLMLEAAVAP